MPIEESPVQAADEIKLVEPENPLPPIALDDLPERVRGAVSRAGWKKLMPVQSRTMPYLLSGRDMMVQSRTGSGKTGAFVLPILSLVDTSKVQCQALVLVPTRELAQQVSTEAAMLSGGEVNVVAVYGGVGYGPQLDAFEKGAHLVVGTPGRILDHLIRGSLKLDGVRMLIFDEADRMMSMGFYPDMRQVQRYLPRNRSGAMFSATYPTSVLNLAKQFLREPGFLSLSHDSVHVTGTEHIAYIVPGIDKDRSLVRLIETENPASAIIFCNTKVNVNYVTRVLQRFGHDADQLSSDLAQGAREKVLGRLREKNLRFLVATDVAARGIDISGLSHVFQYDFPEDHESYIHRAGRTGRAGAAGIAITLVSTGEQSEMARLAKRFDIDMEVRPVPTDEDVVKTVSERVTALLEAKLRQRDRLQVERMQRFMPLARNLGQNEDELALLAMLLDDYYQQSLHAAPSLPEGQEAAAPRSSSGRGSSDDFRRRETAPAPRSRRGGPRR